MAPSLLEQKWLAAVIRENEEPTTLHERTVALQASTWGGAEIRPTRVFLWLGPRRNGREWVVSTGNPPTLLGRRLRRRHVQIACYHISFLGNPAFTVSLLALNTLRRLFDRS